MEPWILLPVSRFVSIGFFVFVALVSHPIEELRDDCANAVPFETLEESNVWIAGLDIKGTCWELLK